jgi:hypothetical protein
MGGSTRLKNNITPDTELEEFVPDLPDISDRPT